MGLGESLGGGCAMKRGDGERWCGGEGDRCALAAARVSRREQKLPVLLVLVRWCGAVKPSSPLA